MRYALWFHDKQIAIKPQNTFFGFYPHKANVKSFALYHKSDYISSPLPFWGSKHSEKLNNNIQSFELILTNCSLELIPRSITIMFKFRLQYIAKRLQLISFSNTIVEHSLLTT